MLHYIETKDGERHTIGAEKTPIPCFRCGLCCMHYLVKPTTDDLKRLAKGLGITINDLIDKYVEKISIGYVLRRTKNKCIFLTYEDNETIASCSAYDFRPEDCQNWVPSLSRPECQEGLRKLGKSDKILLST